MARKPAQSTKAETEEAPIKDGAQENTEGAQPADHSAVALTSTPDDDGQGATGGEDRSDLPATNLVNAEDAKSGEAERAEGLAALVPTNDDIEIIGIDLAKPEDLAQSVDDLVVLCHRKDGRRRAGRKWPNGETRVSSAELTDFQLAQLEGDPAFTVFYTEKE